MPTRSAAALLFAVGVLACAGSDPVKDDRFGHVEDDDGGDTAGAGGGNGDAGATGTSGGTGGGAAAAGGSSGDPSGSSTSGSGSTGAPACPDSGPGEPNDTEGSATDLGAIDDCDGSGASVSGVLAGDDVDWYVYHGDDAFGCIVNPSRSLQADQSVRICKFVECDGGPIEIACPEGTSTEESPDGRSGCCSLAAFELSPDCPSATDAATIYVRLDKQPAFDCVPYALGWHY